MVSRPVDLDPDPIDAILADPIKRARLMEAIAEGEADMAAGRYVELSLEEIGPWLASLRPTPDA